jgi:hypothetical protein
MRCVSRTCAASKANERARSAAWVALLCSLWSGAAAAQSEESAPAPVEIHGFVSQGLIKSTKNNYLAESKRGSVEFAEVGINFTKSLTDELRVGFQLFSRDLGPLGNYTPQFDWFYLDYRFRDWFGIRAGRTKIPFGLYNEANDIDAARIPILLPQSVYPVDHRDYLFAQTGGEVYGDIRLGGAGSLEYRLYGGTLFLPPASGPAPGITVSHTSVPYVVGGRAMWSTPLDGLVAGGSAQALRVDGDYNFAPELSAPLQAVGYLPMGFDGSMAVKFRVKLYVASLEYTQRDLTLSAEYSRWVGGFESEAPLLFPTQVINERAYAMASYRVTPWFTPGLYYSLYYPNVDKRDAKEDYQHDAALTLRYDVTPNWLVKVEGHFMHGTAALDNKELNEGKEQKDLVKNWTLLLLKTTAYF